MDPLLAGLAQNLSFRFIAVGFWIAAGLFVGWLITKISKHMGGNT